MVISLQISNVLYTPQLAGHQGPVWDVVISPAGRIAMSVSEDQYALLWDLETGDLVREYQIIRSGLFNAGFMPDGRLAVLGTLDGRVALLNPYYGQIEREFLGHQGRVRTSCGISTSARRRRPAAQVGAGPSRPRAMAPSSCGTSPPAWKPAPARAGS